MKRILFTILGFFFFAMVGSPLFSQITNYKYHKIRLKSDDIKPFYNSAGFYKFQFNFMQTSNQDHYILKGTAYNSEGTPIGNSFEVGKIFLGGNRQLPNIELGYFTLTKAQMDSLGMSVDTDYTLHPIKYHESKPDQKDYVSYRVTIKGEKAGSPFTQFEMDPSPPAEPPAQ